MSPKLSPVIVRSALVHVERGEFEGVVASGETGDFEETSTKIGQGVTGRRVVVDGVLHDSARVTRSGSWLDYRLKRLFVVWREPVVPGSTETEWAWTAREVVLAERVLGNAWQVAVALKRRRAADGGLGDHTGGNMRTNGIGYGGSSIPLTRVAAASPSVFSLPIFN